MLEIDGGLQSLAGKDDGSKEGGVGYLADANVVDK